MELVRWMDRDCTVREKNTNTEGISVIDEVQTMTTASKSWEAYFLFLAKDILLDG